VSFTVDCSTNNITDRIEFVCFIVFMEVGLQEDTEVQTLNSVYFMTSPFHYFDMECNGRRSRARDRRKYRSDVMVNAP